MNSHSLRGIVVVALEQAVAAPLCSCRLADAGARVIKIERADGDFARHYDSAVNGESAYFAWLNRGKESVVIDLKDSADVALLKRMILKADIFIENLAPGAAARAGVAPGAMRSQKPELITCSISGYGPDGPYRHRKAYDLLIQAETGLASVTGIAAAPGRVGVSVADIAAGMNAYAAVLEAILARTRTGKGANLSVSLFDSIAEWMTVPLLHFDYAGKAPSRVGLHHPTIAPYGLYSTQLGDPVLIAIQNEREWRLFCHGVLGEPAVADDSRFRCNTARVVNREALDELIQQVFANVDWAVLERQLVKARIAYGRLNDVARLSTHPQLRRVAVRTSQGIALLPAPAANIGEAHEVEFGEVPRLGQHTNAIRREFSPSSGE